MKTRLVPPAIPKADKPKRLGKLPQIPRLPRTQTEPPPPDLSPIPARDHPWPNDEPLDPDIVKSALWHGRGNIKRAAELLRTTQARLGSLVRRDPDLSIAREEAAELLLDEAEAVMVEAIQSDDPVRADTAARFVLERAGRIRGWTRDGSGGVSLSFGGANAANGALAIKWQTE